MVNSTALEKPKIAIIILAAGSSSRMKRIKQLLPWGKTTLIGNVIEQALKSDADSVYVVLGANYKLIESEVAKFPVTIINNNNWKHGLSESILSGIKYLGINNSSFDGILFALVDQPLIKQSYFNELINKFKLNSSKLSVASNYGQVNGVPAIFPKNEIVKLLTLKGDFGAKKILNSNRTISIKACEVILDIDTYDVYKRIYKQYF